MIIRQMALTREKKGFVECLTPDEKMDRYYRAAGTGKKVAGFIAGKGE